METYCYPPGVNRKERRNYRRFEHVWKTGDPKQGQFCAVCGVAKGS